MRVRWFLALTLVTCRPPESDAGDCNANTDCPSGMLCVELACREQCQVDYDCSLGSRCVRDLCRALSTTGEFCTGPNDCIDGHTCEQNRCLRPMGELCSNNAQCVDTCILGQCAVRSDLHGGCDDVQDCSTGQVCAGNS